ncbi:MAG: UvrB/UvrC motif-containing protein [bacterium]
MPLMCKICGVHPATVHFTEIVNQKVVAMDLCAQCAEERGIDVETAGQFGLGDLAAGFINSVAQTESEKIGKVRCPRCGYDYSEFKKVGRLGCPECYQAFEVQLLVLLRQIHGSTQHKGRTPEQLGPKAMIRQELMDLKDQLHRAVEKEEYEQAAQIRDRIKELEIKAGES